jgi:hypothetical protein
MRRSGFFTDEAYGMVVDMDDRGIRILSLITNMSRAGSGRSTSTASIRVSEGHDKEYESLPYG